MLLLQGALQRHAVCGGEGLEGQGGGCFCVGAALLEGAGAVAAHAQVGGRPQAGGVEGTRGEGLVDLLRLAPALPPVSADAACAAAAAGLRAEDVRLRGAVVFQVAAVPRVQVGQVDAPVGLFRQALKNVLARRAVRKELWGKGGRAEEKTLNGISDDLVEKRRWKMTTTFMRDKLRVSLQLLSRASHSVTDLLSRAMPLIWGAEKAVQKAEPLSQHESQLLKFISWSFTVCSSLQRETLILSCRGYKRENRVIPHLLRSSRLELGLRSRVFK